MPSVAIVILAAGESTRMTLLKQLLPIRGRNLLRHTIDQAVASKAASVSVVLGADATLIQQHIGHAKCSVVLNPDWHEGMSTSIRAGISAVPDSLDSAIISLCDQPYLSPSVFDALIEKYSTSGKSIVGCEYNGSIGPPVLFSRKHFLELTSLQGDAGAKRVIGKHEGEVARVSFPSGSVDLDTPEDYRRFIQEDLGMHRE